MIKLVNYLLIFGTVFLCSSCIDALQFLVKDYEMVASKSTAIQHDIWDDLVKKHVTDRGLVDYVSFQKDSAKLDDYLTLLSSHHPNEENWTRDEAIAYWINAYNAFTVQLILDHYPLESIKDIKKGLPLINTIWDKQFFEIEGVAYDLNTIEHSILRTYYKEPRVHFVLNCASISCPNLMNWAVKAVNLDQQLDKATLAFLNDTQKNKFDPGHWQISKIFKWYKSDFDPSGGVVEFISKYQEKKPNPKVKLSYLDYDWNLNDAN